MALPKVVLPKAPYDDGRANPDYPWLQGSAGLLGDRNTTFANPDATDEAYNEIIHHDGTFEHKEANGLESKLSKEVRGYVSSGDSRNTDGQSASYNQSSKLVDVKIDMGQSSGGDLLKGHGGKELGGAKEGSYNGTDGDTFKTSKGNVIKTHDGDIHSSTDGDHISTVIGTHYHTVVGEHGINVQDGNYDLKVNSGQLQMNAASNITINSTTKIIFKCGVNTIELSSSGLVFNINSGSVTVNAPAGDITTAAISTKMQGGGKTAPPTTFK